MKTLGIIYRRSLDEIGVNLNLFHRFADAEFVSAEDLKSTTGYVFLAMGGAITWKSKKQTIIVLSSTEVEYVALSKTPTVIKGNNEGSVILSY
jgi:hypothetical protein